MGLSYHPGKLYTYAWTEFDPKMKIGAHGFEVEIDVFGDTDPRKMPASLFHEAVDVDYDSALKADVSKQASATCPRYWYIPATFLCMDCKKEFLFAVEEQRFWYEERKFFPGVTPVRCATCRKTERVRRLDEQRPRHERAS